jgi:hypothetical protein
VPAAGKKLRDWSVGWEQKGACPPSSRVPSEERTTPGFDKLLYLIRSNPKRFSDFCSGGEIPVLSQALEFRPDPLFHGSHL